MLDQLLQAMPEFQSQHSNAFGLSTAQPLGQTEPRIFTPPLRELKPAVLDEDGNVIEEATSYGFAVVDFARDVLLEPLDPWEEFAVIHAGELLPDGRPRFRKVLILVARQNGKTHLLRVLTLFWLFVEEWPVVLGLNSDRTYAKKQLLKVTNMAKENEFMRALLPAKKNAGFNGQTGEESLTTAAGCEYSIAAVNRRAGRSLSIDRLIVDELREHRSWDAWDACMNAMNARPYAQAFCITNQGDDNSKVLDKIHEDTLAAIKSGDTEYRTCLLEWSAEPGADVLDLDQLAKANPNLGRRVLVENIWDDLMRAKRQGGEEEGRVRTEVLCQRVHQLDAAVDPEAWNTSADPAPLVGSELRSRVALCLDVSPDRLHASLAAAAVLPDGRVRVEIVASWGPGSNAVDQMRKALPEWDKKIKPQTIGWFPTGPAAVLAADMQDKKMFRQGITVSEIRQDTAAVCMGFSEQVSAKGIAHSKQPLLDMHVTSSAKLWNGDVWKFSRKGDGHCDAAYAAAGAVHLARTLPAPLRTGIVLPSGVGGQ